MAAFRAMKNVVNLAKNTGFSGMLATSAARSSVIFPTMRLLHCYGWKELSSVTVIPVERHLVSDFDLRRWLSTISYFAEFPSR